MGQRVVELKVRSEQPAQLSEQNPYLFIVGCDRSGTTLLQRMVDAHRHIAIIYETHWITRRFAKGKGLTPDGLVTRELISRLFKYYRFPELGIGRDELEKLLASGAPVSYSSFVTAIFDLYGNARGKRLV